MATKYYIKTFLILLLYVLKGAKYQHNGHQHYNLIVFTITIVFTTKIGVSIGGHDAKHLLSNSFAFSIIGLKKSSTCLGVKAISEAKIKYQN